MQEHKRVNYMHSDIILILFITWKNYNFIQLYKKKGTENTTLKCNNMHLENQMERIISPGFITCH